MGFYKIMLALALIILVAMFFIRFVDEVSYSWKSKQEMNDNNATCYFDRGWFNIPLGKVCTYNDTLLLEKENISVFPIGKMKLEGSEEKL